MADMTSRERVVAALNHQEPDRVPLDLGGGSSTSIVVEGYENLKQFLKVPGETRILNKVFRVAQLDESVMKRLGSDCRPLGLKPPARWKSERCTRNSTASPGISRMVTILMVLPTNCRRCCY